VVVRRVNARQAGSAAQAPSSVGIARARRRVRASAGRWSASCWGGLVWRRYGASDPKAARPSCCAFPRGRARDGPRSRGGGVRSRGCGTGVLRARSRRERSGRSHARDQGAAHRGGRAGPDGRADPGGAGEGAPGWRRRPLAHPHGRPPRAHVPGGRRRGGNTGRRRGPLRGVLGRTSGGVALRARGGDGAVQAGVAAVVAHPVGAHEALVRLLFLGREPEAEVDASRDRRKEPRRGGGVAAPPPPRAGCPRRARRRGRCARGWPPRRPRPPPAPTGWTRR
jgi:hypothetical protein